MRQVIWSNRSILDLERSIGYVARFNPAASVRLQQRFVRASESLGDNPDRGRAKGGVRELVVISPYIMRYRVGASEVTILRIRHGARRPL